MTASPSEPRKSLKQRFSQMRDAYANVPGAFALVWQADRRSTLLMLALTLAGAGIPALQAWVTKLIVDIVVQSVAGASAAEGLRSALPYLFAEFGLLLASQSIGQFRRLLEELLDHRLGHYINTQIIRKALTLDLHYFEDADFYDKMQNARRQSEFRALGIINSGFLLLQNLVTLFSFLVILLAFSPWVALILFGAVIPSFIVQSHYGQLNFRLQSWRAPESRRMQYFEHVLTTDSTVKEIKLFGLGDSLLKQYDEIFWKTFREDQKVAWRRSWFSLLWGLLASVSYYGCYAWIIYLAVGRTITLGEMTLYLTLFRQSQGTFQGVFDNLARLFENGLFMENLFNFLKIPGQKSQPAQKTEPTHPPAPPSPSQSGIEFRGVSFRYPGRSHWTIRDLNLTIAPQEKLALVGENGAGKTTLIKLLTRLYDPTEGQILLNGRDLRDYPLEELHRKIGVIFQDFVRYQLTVRENIGFGAIENLGDPSRVELAARRSGADEVIQELPEGLDTTLGQWFKGGHELSGGQWQKIALSRAFMRESEVLVLDEPTSALDAEREYEIFQKFKELTQGRIALLISHRFSTVRMADRIAVLREGAIHELGSHEELLKLGGTYARLFRLQAEGYR